MPPFKRQQTIPVRPFVPAVARRDATIDSIGNAVNQAIGLAGTLVQAGQAKTEREAQIGAAKSRIAVQEQQMTFADLRQQTAIKRAEETALRRQITEAEKDFKKLEAIERTKLEAASLTGQPLPEGIVSEDNQQYKRFLAGKGAAREGVYGSGPDSFSTFLEQAPSAPFVETVGEYVNQFGGEDDVYRLGMVSGLMKDFSSTATTLFRSRRADYGRQVQLGAKSDIRHSLDGYLSGDSEISDLNMGLKRVQGSLFSEVEAGAIDMSKLDVNARMVATMAAVFGDHLNTRMTSRMKAAVNTQNTEEVGRTIGIIDSQIDDIERIYRKKRYGAVGGDTGEMIPEAERALATLKSMRNDLARMGYEASIKNTGTVAELLSTSDKLLDLSDDWRDQARIMEMRSTRYDQLVRQKKSATSAFITNEMDGAGSQADLVNLYLQINGNDAIGDLPASIRTLPGIEGAFQGTPVMEMTVPTLDGKTEPLYNEGELNKESQAILSTINKLAAFDDGVSSVNAFVLGDGIAPRGLTSGIFAPEPEHVIGSFNQELGRRGIANVLDLNASLKDPGPQEDRTQLNMEQDANVYGETLTLYLEKLGFGNIPDEMLRPVKIGPGSNGAQWNMFLTTARHLKTSPIASSVLEDALGEDDFGKMALWAASARTADESDTEIQALLTSVSGTQMGLLQGQLLSVDKEGEFTGSLTSKPGNIMGVAEGQWKGRWILERVKQEGALIAGGITPADADAVASNKATASINRAWVEMSIHGNVVRFPSTVVTSAGDIRAIDRIGQDNLERLLERKIRVGLAQARRDTADRAVDPKTGLSGAELDFVTTRELILDSASARIEGNQFVIPIVAFRKGAVGFFGQLFTRAERERPLNLLPMFEISIPLPRGDSGDIAQLLQSTEGELRKMEVELAGVIPLDSVAARQALRKAFEEQRPVGLPPGTIFVPEEQ